MDCSVLISMLKNVMVCDVLLADEVMMTFNFCQILSIQEIYLVLQIFYHTHLNYMCVYYTMGYLVEIQFFLFALAVFPALKARSLCCNNLIGYFRVCSIHSCSRISSWNFRNELSRIGTGKTLLFACSHFSVLYVKR